MGVGWQGCWQCLLGVGGQSQRPPPRGQPTPPLQLQLPPPTHTPPPVAQPSGARPHLTPVQAGPHPAWAAPLPGSTGQGPKGQANKVREGSGRPVAFPVMWQEAEASEWPWTVTLVWRGLRSLRGRDLPSCCLGVGWAWGSAPPPGSCMGEEQARGCHRAEGSSWGGAFISESSWWTGAGRGGSRGENEGPKLGPNGSCPPCPWGGAAATGLRAGLQGQTHPRLPLHWEAGSRVRRRNRPVPGIVSGKTS